MKRGSVRNQEVTDAQGRRRFHGAFTGGFSAGYYNSVGSQEGWTPTTFSSSRDNRSSRVEQRPEDFMDEEDDPLLGKRLETTEHYDTLQTGAKRRLQQQPDRTEAAIPGFSLPEDWVLPVNDSIGAKLLKQMGWKEGHGIGQRVRKRKFQDEKDTEQVKLLMLDSSEEKTETEPLQEEEVYVPPRKMFDVQKSFPKPKLDRYGAGFDPYRDAPEFSMHRQQQEEKVKEKEGSHRQMVSFLDALKTTDGSNRATSGYGLSALEENDDIDVYGTVSMSQFDRVIAPLGARKEAKRLDSSAQESRRYEKTRRSRELCSDGRVVLPGFELAVSKEKPPKAVNLRLSVPSDFKAYHRFADEDQVDAVTTLNTRQPLKEGSGDDLHHCLSPMTVGFRATISASIAKRFVSSKSTLDEDKNDAIIPEQPQATLSRRSQSLWIPKSLLCKRFHVKCAGPTGSSGKGDEDDKKPDLFDKEIVPHLMEFAADRAAQRQSKASAGESSKFTIAVESNEDRDLPALPTVEKASTDLLKSIFEPSDESELSEDDSEDESDDEERNEVQVEAKQLENPARSTSKTLLLTRNSVEGQRRQLSSEDSSLSGEEGKNEDTRGRKRSGSVDNVSVREAKRWKEEEKKKRKKHKKHHKHRSSRDDKDKKKDKKDRKSDKHRSSRHSRRRRSRSAERNSRSRRH
ncbi:G-patch domain [Phytophthora infestans]|uniref:G-patch domain n=1 Tax=Phytophthora infestans TaxID=4787 RepID=A0A8S9UJ78_PHYIN|nr:G-patch domain [Phytophthora infestans]